MPDFVYEGLPSYDDQGYYKGPLPSAQGFAKMFQRQAKGAFKTTGSEQWPVAMCQWLSAMLLSSCLLPAKDAVGKGGAAALDDKLQDSFPINAPEGPRVLGGLTTLGAMPTVGSEEQLEKEAFRMAAGLATGAAVSAQAAMEGDAETKSLIGVSDVISATLKKQHEAKKEEARKEAEKRNKAIKAARKEQETKDEADDTYQIMDKSGLGNFMEKTEVMDIMKNTVKTAVSQSGSRCQVSTRTFMDEKLYTNAQAKFESLGDLKAVKGFIFIRGPKEEPGVKLTLLRPATVYVALSKAPNEDDPFLRTWQVSGSDFNLPEFSEDIAPIHEVKKKVYRDPDNRNIEVPKPPSGLETCLVFVLPDFHAEMFGEEKLSEEELQEKERAEAAARRAGRSTASSSTKEAPSKADEIEAILKKVEAGEKLSNKEIKATLTAPSNTEKRAYDKHQEKNVVYKNEDDEPVGGMNAFSIILEGGKNEPPPSGDAFVCNNFTLSAPKQTLFDNASITIVQGHRYGILGPNGQGKTTLLRHIAAREMPVPVNWDVILVEQEAKATERSAVEEVLAADVRAAELIKLEEELLQKLEDMETAMEKGEEVSADEVERMRSELENASAELEAIGADSAEARVRKILCGLGFTNGHPDEDRFSMDRP
eukprot:s9606_g1.t1